LNLFLWQDILLSTSTFFLPSFYFHIAYVLIAPLTATLLPCFCFLSTFTLLFILDNISPLSLNHPMHPPPTPSLLLCVPITQVETYHFSLHYSTKTVWQALRGNVSPSCPEQRLFSCCPIILHYCHSSVTNASFYTLIFNFCPYISVILSIFMLIALLCKRTRGKHNGSRIWCTFLWLMI